MGREKLNEIAAATEETPNYIEYEPNLELGLVFYPSNTASTYLTWLGLDEIFPISYPGVKTSRDEALTDFDRDVLFQRITQYFDPAVSNTEASLIVPRLMRDAPRFNAAQIRSYLVQRGFNPENIVRYYYRPFDLRWLYWEPETKLLDEKRPDYFPQVFGENYWLAAVQFNRKSYDPPIALSQLGSLHLIERGANLFPLYLRNRRETLFSTSEGLEPNLTRVAEQYLTETDSTPADLFFHTLAILHATDYARENADALRQDFPRIPLPVNSSELSESAGCGRRIASLLNTEEQVNRVTVGEIPEHLKVIGNVINTNNRQFDIDDFRLTAGWGRRQGDGAIMPGKGRIESRDYSENELKVIGDGTIELLGKTTFDIYLNNFAYWRNVPERIWNYKIGGYQVIKKWLSYREFAVLGRSLRLEEVEEVTNMIRRIAALILMEPELNANYQKIKANTFDWQSLK